MFAHHSNQGETAGGWSGTVAAANSTGELCRAVDKMATEVKSSVSSKNDSGFIVKRTTGESPEVSVVIPCLNEAQSVGLCIDKALAAFREHRIRGEVVVADNGSTDGSVEIARDRGARVVHVSTKGYGNALRKGIEEAFGDFIIMGDADDSYDFSELPKFVEKWRAGSEFVKGGSIRRRD